MTKSELARKNFEDGCNCCQSVVLAFAEEMGLTRETATLLSAGLGGGVGRLREICGAVSGAAIVLGMLHGSPDPRDRERKAALYAEIQRFAAAFAARHGSYICRDLLGLPPGADDPVPGERTSAYYAARPCAGLVASMAELIEQEIAE